MQASGSDSDGREFQNCEEMWREQVCSNRMKLAWYQQGVAYWEGVEASIDGVLGGYSHVNDIDIQESEEFLRHTFFLKCVRDTRRRSCTALDCGAGIGRVTKNLLLNFFDEVDLLEPVSHFLDAARASLANDATSFFCISLQDFTPVSGRYDVIWIQWCIGHLTDDDFISFFKRAKIGLKAGGMFIVKENVAKSGFVVDNNDRSITRSQRYFMELFQKCGLHCFQTKLQRGFPEELFAVRMYALKPHDSKSKMEGSSNAI